MSTQRTIVKISTTAFRNERKVHDAASFWDGLLHGALHGDDLVVEPTEGGSLAFHCFERAGLPVITLPISNDDCHQHSHDENLLLSTLFRGVDQWLAILADPGQPSPTPST